MFSRASAITVPGIVLSQPHEHRPRASSWWPSADQLDRVGDDLAADERGAHALGAHGDAVGHRDGVELHRRAAGRADAILDVLGEPRRWKLHGPISVHVLAMPTSGFAGRRR